MSGAPRLYSPEFAAACVLHFAGAMSLAMFLLFPLYIKTLGGTELTIGLVLGVGAATSVAARPLVGVLLDRVGRRRVMLWGGIANACSWLPFCFLTTAGPWLFLWASLHDVVWGALFAAYFTYAADLVPPARRAEGIAVFGVAGMTANGLAPILGEVVIVRAGYVAFFATAIAFALISAVIALRVRERPLVAASGSPWGSLRDVARLARHPALARVLVATGLLGIAINAAYLFTAPFTRVLGIERVGPFFAAYSATSIVIRVFGRRVLDTMGPHRISLPGFAAFAVGLFVLAALVPGPAASMILVAGGIACGAGHGSLFPVLNALAIGRGPTAMQGAVVGLHTAALDFGAVLGGPLCGAVAERAGYPVMYVLAATCCVAGLTLMATDPVRQR